MAKVLVVDDAEFVRLRLTKILKTHNLEVIEARNGAEAVSLYVNAWPDVVLMDITMPEKDGLEALQELRAIDPQARVIMLSALGQEAIILDALRRGACDFVVKPFDAEQVFRILNKFLDTSPQTFG